MHPSVMGNLGPSQLFECSTNRRRGLFNNQPTPNAGFQAPDAGQKKF